MDEQTQRNAILAAVDRTGLVAEDLWPDYFGQGGNCSEYEIEAYLDGDLPLPALERDVFASSVNDALVRMGHDSQVPYSWDLSSQSSLHDPATALGAAGQFLLSSEAAEAERLAALLETNLLDSGPDERFDRIVREAQEYFDVSSATVSLIAGDRQFVKSAVGPVRQNIPRAIAFCNETIRTNRLMVVPDARTDARYCSNPLVLGEPYIRFYAGFPLHGRRGWNIGTLDIIDQHPHGLSPKDRSKLREFARRAQEQIDA